MVTVTTYKVYISGQLPNPTLSGDIDPTSHEITVVPHGSSMIGLSLSGLTDELGNPVSYTETPVTFNGGQPDFVSWARLSPTLLLITNLNFKNRQVSFSLFTGASGLVAVQLPIDPTIVNTYIPPPMLGGQAAAQAPQVRACQPAAA
jgi:hypothetical protein